MEVCATEAYVFIEILLYKLKSIYVWDVRPCWVMIWYLCIQLSASVMARCRKHKDIHNGQTQTSSSLTERDRFESESVT